MIGIGCAWAACAATPPRPAAPASTAPTSPVVAQPALAGAWQGALLANSLRLALHIEHTGSGWTAKMDSLIKARATSPLGR